MGAAFVDFALPALSLPKGTLGDELQRPSDYVGPKPRAPSRALVVSFFATWCRPCFTLELPELVRLQSEYGPSGLRVLAVNVRGPGESLQEAIEQTKLRLRDRPELGFPVLFERTSQAAKAYLGHRAQLPATFVFDPAGRVVFRSEGADRASLEGLELAVEAQVKGVRPLL